MATANEILVGRFNWSLACFFGIKVPGTPVPQLAPEVQPSFDLGAPPPELLYLGGELLAAGSTAVAGGAATSLYVQLINSAAFGVLVIVEEIFMYSSTVTGIVSLRLWSTLSTGAAASAGVYRDFRAIRSATSPTNLRVAQGTFRSADITIFGTVIFQANFAVAELPPVIYCSPIVMPSGSNLLISTETTNTTLDIFAAWRERAIEASELI